MKSTGIVRKIDELGRIVLPIEIRRTMNLEIKDPLEIYVDNEMIILKKHSSSCVFCGSTDENILYKDKFICKKCLEEIKK